jgi:TolB-like protein/DNA-binding winged helix-turn-helix (wHTH) protein/tetratricopeptide (TPR) repeat protein
VGEWIADPALDLLIRGAESVKLEPRTMSVLVHLMQRRLRVVSQSELESAVWTGVVVTPQSVYQAIAQLRRVFGDDAREPRYIATVPRKGYRLIATVEPIVEDEPRTDGAQPRQQVPAGAASTPAAGENNPLPAINPARAGLARFNRLRVWLGAGALVAAAVVAAFIFLWRPAATPAPPSLAVLPFADLSAEKSNAVFCDGLTDELTSALADLSEMRVMARNSTFLFRDSHADVRVIGRRLGVAYVLQGSVRREGDRLRIMATLVDTSTGFQRWTRTFEGTSRQILSIQQEVAREVVDSLRLRLSPRSSARLTQAPSTNVPAYELYLLGRYQGQQRTPAALTLAVDYHRQAIALDPHFALAHAGLADALMSQVYYSNRGLNDMAPHVEAAANRAIELDPRLAEGYAARGVLRTEQWRLDEAVADLRTAIALKPNYSEALVRLGLAHEYRAHPREALASYDEARQLDPLHFMLHIRRCLTLQNLGQYREADEACQRALELNPKHPNAHWTLGLNALAQGNLPDAIRGYRAALAESPARTDLLAQLGWLLLDVGLPDQARIALDEAVARYPTDLTWPQLERARLFVATNSPADLAAYLRTVNVESVGESVLLYDAALLSLAARDVPRAQSLARLAQQAGPPTGSIFKDVWATRWGRSPLLTLALVAQTRGDQDAARHYFDELDQWLTLVEREGQVWYGVDYLRADMLASEGQTNRAFTELDRAIDRGWRRGWWMKMDPALASIRSDARFARELARIDALAADARRRLALN